MTKTNKKQQRNRPKRSRSNSLPVSLSTEPFSDAAMVFAERGWKVFPVAPIGDGPNRKDGKEPFPGTRGFKDATSEPNQIAEWCKSHPDANIGLACEASRLIAVDVDLDLDDPEQSARWERYQASHDMPETFAQQTAGGGLHLVYSASPGIRYPGSMSDGEGKIADIKHHGYILLGPSVAQSGRRSEPGTYEIIENREPAPAPAWLAERQASRADVAQPADRFEKIAHNVREIRRREKNDRLILLLQRKRNTIKSRDEWLRLGHALHAGYDGTRWELEAHIAWLDFSRRWEASPGTKPADYGENADQVWQSATANRRGGVLPATAQKILGTLPDLPPQDVEPVVPTDEPKIEDNASIRLTGLAGQIADAVRQASDRTLEVLPEGAALVAMSALAAPKFVLRGPQGRTTLNIFALLLGGTGSGKEAARTASDMVLKAARRRDELLDGVASDRALHRALTEGGEARGAPTGSRGARVIAVDEGGLHLDAIRKGNNGHQKSLLALMMRLFGLGLLRLPPHKYADARNEIGAVENPRLTMIWTSTPEAFEKATGQEDSESGQMNRFLVFKEEGFPSLRNGAVNRDLLRDPPEEIAAAARRFPARTINQTVAARTADQDTDETIEMSEKARDAFNAFRIGEVEDCRQRGGLEGESWARATEYSLRIAGLLALSDAAMDPGTEPLADVKCKLRHVELAIKIVRRCTLGVVRLARNAGKSETEQLKDKVLLAIRKHADADGFARARDVHRECLRNAKKFVRDGIIEALKEDAEILIRQKDDTGGRPAIIYAIATDCASANDLDP